MKYFKESEFENFSLMNTELLSNLDSLREYLAVPIIISSSTGGEHEVGSQHYQGNAVDIVIPNYRGSLFSLYLIIERFNFTGIGIYPDWQYNGSKLGGFHLDQRFVKNQGARWIGLSNQVSGKNKYIGLTAKNLYSSGILTNRRK